MGFGVTRRGQFHGTVRGAPQCDRRHRSEASSAPNRTSRTARGGDATKAKMTAGAYVRRSDPTGVFMDLESLRNTPPWDWPEDAGELLLDTLANEKANESHRLLAAELASELVVMSDELADALMAIVINGAEPLELRT